MAPRPTHHGEAMTENALNTDGRRWPFDEAKLRRLLEAARHAEVARHDVHDRHQEAVAARSYARSHADRVMASNGSISSGAARSLEIAEREVERISAERNALIARTSSTLAVARRCEEYARGLGWTPSGAPERVLGPRVVGGAK